MATLAPEYSDLLNFDSQDEIVQEKDFIETKKILKVEKLNINGKHEKMVEKKIPVLDKSHLIEATLDGTMKPVMEIESLNREKGTQTEIEVMNKETQTDRILENQKNQGKKKIKLTHLSLERRWNKQKKWKQVYLFL